MDLSVNLKGKTALITGSTSGIGLGIAHRLAANGANIALNSFSDTPDDHAVAVELADTYGVRAAYFQADMSDGQQCRDVVGAVDAAFGSIDILVNNAGIQFVSPIDEFPIEKYEQIMAINLHSNWHTIAAVLPFMRAKGWGRIVNISSAHGLTASKFKSAYVAAKHGVMGLTKVVGLETAEEDITCNAIAPGYVLTPLVEAQIPDTMKQYNLSREEVVKTVLLERQPSKEFATVDEIGDTVAYLCSSAAKQITGTSISVDGGWTAL